MKLTSVVFALIALLPSIARAQETSDYAARSREAVEKELRRSGKSAGEFRIEILGEPNLLARHALLHRATTKPPSGRAILSGRVVNARWEVATGVRLLLASPRDPGVPISVVTSTTGQFQFPDVATGNYQLKFDGIPNGIPVVLEEGHQRILVSAPSHDFHSLFTGEDAGPRVFAKVYRDNKLDSFHQVNLAGSNPSVDSADLSDTESVFDGAGVASFPSEPELTQLTKDVAPLLAALLDVTRGPERLKPFLSSRIACRIYDSGERQIPTIDDQRCALNLLDSFALSLWFQIEGAGSYPGALVLDWYKDPQKATDEELLTTALNRHAVLRNELRDAGMFEPEHSSLIQRHFRASFGESPIAKFRMSEPVPELPLPDGDLYSLPLPVILVREGNALRIAAVFLAGG